MASFMQIVVDGPRSNGMPPFGYCRMCNFFFYFILVVGCFLLTTLYGVCNFKGFALTVSLYSYCMVFMVYWLP